MADFDALIVGGGHNGLICAAYLAREGLRPLVLERRGIPGGACVTEEIAGAPGYRVSTGAAQCGNLRPEIVRGLELQRFGFELLMPDPLTVFPFPGGRYLALWQDASRTRREIEKFSSADARAFADFYKECVAFTDLIEPLLYDAEHVPSVGALQEAFHNAGRDDLFRAFFLGSVWDLLEDRFEADAVKGVLGFTSTFGTNAGPRTPGTAYIMAHHMFGGTAGVKGRAGYVRGGMGGLARALSAAALHYGAELRVEAEVGRILVSHGSVRGVELTDGERLTGEVVVSNADPWRTFLGLIDRDRLSPGFVQAVQEIEMQGVALKVNCALKRLPRFRAAPPRVAPARVSLCPSLDYMEAAWDEAKRGRPSPEPFMTVHMQSAVDESLAPLDRHTLTCYAQYFPYHLRPELNGWDSQRDRAGEIVLRTVASYAPDLYDVIEATEVLTPLDLEQRFAMTGGHQFHGDLLPGHLLDHRPAPGCLGARTPVEGLYLCGSGAHPGGCVWGAPGERAARAVLADRKQRSAR